jgi:signal transduction histidine kinase
LLPTLAAAHAADTQPQPSISSDTFAEIMHELCMPLSSVGTAVDLLLKDADSIDPRDATDLLHRVRDGTRWLQDLVSDLTSAPLAARVEHPGLSGAPFNLGHSVERAVRVAMPLFESRRQTVELSLPTRPVVVWGEEHLIRRVTLNLLNNAVKYAPEADTVHVTLTTQAKRVVVEVFDHGADLEARELERIFEPQVRGSSANSRNTPGSGLGLSIVKSLVELHGGQVGVQSRLSHGTAFWFTLPRLGSKRRLTSLR